MNTDELLKVEGLKTYYHTYSGTIKAVDDVFLDIAKGELVGLVGESGSGKSTLGLSIIRLVPHPGKIVSGNIWFDGRDLTKIDGKDLKGIRGREISMVFQDPMTSLDPLMRVSDHLMETIRFHTGVSEKEARERSEKLLESVGIPKERFDDYPFQFSGGMRQRVVIALALALDPKLVIADEPTTALDVIVQAQILKLIRDLNRKLQVAVLLITHDLAMVMENCDRIIVMYAGQIFEEATTLNLYSKPLHPYTQSLLQATPNIELSDQKLHYIRGEPPDLANLKPGCRFYDRCPKAMDVCQKKEPKSVDAWKGHLVKCFLYGD